MVEYMLTDLRSELKGASTLRVMTKVNERAMDYYKGQGDLSDLPAESLERRARILHAMGEDDEKRGDLDKALAKFKQAHRVTEALLARDPDNPDRIFGHAQSEYWVGYVAYMRNDWQTTEQFWQHYKQLADQLVKTNPQNPKWIREAGYAAGNLCTLELRRDDKIGNAIDFCRLSVNHMTKLAKLSSQDRQAIRDVVNRYGWLAEAFIKNRDDNSAERAYSKQEYLFQELIATDPENLSLVAQWTRILMTIAEFEYRRGDVQSARSYAAKALVQANRLHRADRDNSKWKKWLHRIETLIPQEGGS